MQEISAFISGNTIATTAAGELTDEYSDESLHVCVLSNLNIKASRIAYGYRESGDKFIESIPPETAYILFDKISICTFFGTDAFSVKPLFYSLQSGSLLIHSNLNDLLIFSEKKSLNLNKVVDYFKWESDDLPADNQTFYQDVFRLLPAQIGIFQNGELAFISNSTISKNTPLLADNEVTDSFKETFENAVSQRKTNAISAANLSGGLDSSSVAAVLSSQLNRELTTVYFDAQKTEADERDFAKNITEKYKTNHQQVTAPDSLLKSLIAVTEKIAQPDPGVLPSFIHEVIFEKIETCSAKRLFSGHGGDNITGYGFEYLDNLFDLKQWRKLKKEGSKYDNLRQNEDSILKSIFKRKIKNEFNKKAYWVALKLTLICLFYFGIIPLPDRFFTTKSKTQLTDYKQLEKKILKVYSTKKSNYFQEFDVANLPKTFTENQRKHVDFCFIRLAINGNEILSTLGHQRDIGVSFPFFDRELLGVSVQATDEQKFGNGYLRGTLRNALADYLPNEIKNRTSKADFTSAALHYFQLLYEDFRVAFPLDHELWKIIDFRTFEQLVDIILDDNYTPQKKVKYTWLGMRVINFGIFMRINNYSSIDDE